MEEAQDFVVYGRPDSDATRRMREYLDYRGITYLFVNLDEDPEAARFVTLSDSEAPTLVLGPVDHREIVSNPNEEQLNEVLNRWGYEDPRRSEDGREGKAARF